MSTWFDEVTRGDKKVCVWIEKEVGGFSLVFNARGISFTHDRQKNVTGWKFEGKSYTRDDILANKTPFREYVQYYYDEYKYCLTRNKKIDYLNDVVHMLPRDKLDKLVTKLEKETGVSYKSDMDWLPKP